MHGLIQLIIYLFDNQPKLLSFIGPLFIANNQDLLGVKSRNFLQKECSKQLEEMNRCNKKCSIRIEGKDKVFLRYEVISTFINTKKQAASVRKELVREVLSKYEFNCNNKAKKIEVSVRYSDSMYQSIALAVAFLYQKCGIARSKSMIDNLNLHNKGSKRRRKKLKERNSKKV